jgi:alkyl sulfatase BDS1-like metallo-beta-lactamase superfamily hydrolase
MADAGHVAWDMGSYQFLLEGKDFESIHPSLQRQAVLNMAYGLYEVVPGKIYQVRGFDSGQHQLHQGRYRLDRLRPADRQGDRRAALEVHQREARQAAGRRCRLLALARRPLRRRARRHRRGRRASGKVQGHRPERLPAACDFRERLRRQRHVAAHCSVLSTAVLLPRSPHGHVDQSIGKNVANGNIGLIAPNLIIEQGLRGDDARRRQDGVPEHARHRSAGRDEHLVPAVQGALGAENITGTIHNIYTLRGAPVRNALNWSKEINERALPFGQEAEVMFASHSWPRWGNARIQEVMRGQRDAYANLNNQVLHYANLGVTINEIQNVYELPKSLQKQWAAHSYHGSEQHNSAA